MPAASRDDGMTSADLDSGGAASPTQGKPKKKRKRGPTVSARRDNPPAEGVQRFDPRPEVRVSPEFRVDADGPCTVRGPVYPSFDPKPGATYSVEEINRLVDSWGTYITARDLGKLKDDYMIRSQLVDRMHDNEVVAGRVVDAVMRGPDDEFPTPTWFGGVRVDDAYAGEVRAGKLRGFSIEVFAFRERIEVVVRGEGEVPDLTGVDKAPFYPKAARVQGERRICIDRMTGLRPIAKSLVDRPAIRQEFAITRSEPVCRFAPEEPMTVENTAEPIVEPRTEQPPAEQPSWLGALVDRIVSAIRRDPSALNQDGTLPPALAAEAPPAAPVVEPRAEPEPQDPPAPPVEPTTPPKEPVMSLAARIVSTPTVAEAVKRMMAVAPPAPNGTEQRADADSWGFNTCWEGQEVAVNLYAMLGLLNDIICMRVLWRPEEFKDNAEVEATLTALARDCTEFLAELRELLEFEVAEENAESGMVGTRSERRAQLVDAARGEAVVRALALLSPESLARLLPAETVEAGTEQRAGKKYSAATVKRLKDTFEACRAACDHLKGMIDEAEPKADESTEERTAPPAPVVVVPPAPTPAEREARALRDQVAEKDKALAEARANLSVRDDRIAELERQAAEREARIAELSTARQPSAQPAPAAAPAAGSEANTEEPDWQSRRAKYREVAAFGRDQG